MTKPKTRAELNDRRRHAAKVLRILAREYPDAVCSLHYANPLQLLIATILSAQCTDERVNLVTPALFERFPDAKAFATADPKEVERLIQSTGFYRNKARNIIACCKALVEQHGGEVPRTLEELVRLPGVGRKTANVVLGNSYGVPGIVVDTHVLRLSRRLGLTHEKTPEKVEQDLMQILPPEEWVAFGHRMIYHGRKICQARKPRCESCPLAEVCPRIGVHREPDGSRSPKAGHREPDGSRSPKAKHREADGSRSLKRRKSGS
ncbi:MAG: endonuclease III [Gemmatales bacterium]|nr:endonuclease III [Gemmatales bacterium]MDW8386323.1 endonuclease III [Gemmatales bacterium]